MLTEQYLIETGIDGFLKLIRSRKNISIGEAAKELKLPQNVISNWANLFEELGIVKISFSFRDPLIQIIEGGDTELRKAEYQLTAKLKQMSESHANLAHMKREITQGLNQLKGKIDFTSAGDVFPDSTLPQFRIKDFSGKLMLDKKTLKHLRTYSIIQTRHLKSIDKQIKENAVAYKKLKDYVNDKNKKLALKNVFLEKRLKHIRKTIDILNNKILRQHLK